MAPWITAAFAVLCDLFLRAMGHDNFATITSTVMAFLLLFDLIRYMQNLLLFFLTLALKLAFVTLILGMFTVRDVWVNNGLPGSIGDLIYVVGNWSKVQQKLLEGVALTYLTILCVYICVALDHFCRASSRWIKELADQEAWRQMQAWREADEWEVDDEEEELW